jgi:thioredoxin reductase (NADPH)
MYDVVIIGGGPAGLAAAAYALDKKLAVALLCAQLGGKAGMVQQLAGQSTPPQPLLGEQAVEELKQRIGMQPECIINGNVVGIRRQQTGFQVIAEEGILQGTAVVIATGAHPRFMNIPDEWQLLGHGLAYSITTHAQGVAGRDVAVVGSTARALRGIAELTQVARRIAVIAPEPGEFDSELGQQLRAQPHVDYFAGYHAQSTEAHDGAVHALIIAKGDETQRIPVSAVFVDMGLVPSSQMFRHFVQCDSDGRIIVDAGQQTSVAGVYAAGDVTNVPCEHILVAIGDGVRAAQSAYDYVLAQHLGSRALQVGEDKSSDNG